MARYTGPREKIERRIGEKLFLKGERSHSQKSAMTKRPYPPGLHGRKRAGKLSEYGQQLKSKQKVKNIYRLLEKQFKSSVKRALESKGHPHEAILNTLENRLDNAVFRAGFAQSRDQARQLVNHGHILVNNKKVGIPSSQIKVGDVMSIREGSKRMPYFSSLMPQWFKNHQAPDWLEVDKDAVSAKIKGHAILQDSGIKIDDLQAIIEYYSR
jgi:small subunit ribosomal protein S4